MADPGFPIGGGVDLIRGAVDARGGYVSKILHVKTKESGPIGGHVLGVPPLDPPMVFSNFSSPCLTWLAPMFVPGSSYCL